MILWDVEEGVPIETLEGHRGVRRNARLQPRRTHPVYGRQRRPRDRLGRGREPPARAPVPDGLRGWEPGHDHPPAFALSPDGRALAVARLDGRVELIDAETLRRTASFEAFPGRAGAAIDYSADGRRLAVAGEGGGRRGLGRRVGSGSARSSALPGALGRSTREPSGARLRPGRSARRGGGGGRGADLGRRPARAASTVAAPACLRVRAGFPARTARSWRFRSVLTPTRVPTESRSSTSQAASGLRAFPRRRGPRGCLLPRRRPARGWHGRRRRAPLGDRRLAAGGTTIARLTADTTAVEFSLDRHTLATSHSDHAVALWDVASQEPIGPPWVLSSTRGTMPGRRRDSPRRRPPVRAIGPRGGQRSEPRRAIRWEVDPRLWLQHVAAVVGSGLTPEQWEGAVPEQDYCPPAHRADGRPGSRLKPLQRANRPRVARPCTEHVPRCRRACAGEYSTPTRGKP